MGRFATGLFIHLIKRLPRRQFNKILALGVGQLALKSSPFALMLQRAWAGAARRLLPPDTQLGSLIYENPKLLDTRYLPLTPLNEFGTMGLTDHPTDLSRWRLSVDGAVFRPQAFTYGKVRALPSIQRDVLLICPGVFAYHARWQGFSIGALLKEVGVDPRADQVLIKGPAGPYQKVEEFSMGEIECDQIFLAHAVNGGDLPPKHGFPLRAVAGDHMGFQWVKFVDTITAKITGAPAAAPPPATPGPSFVP
jgi:sulfoxide reductase catalytic subunit YedY